VGQSSDGGTEIQIGDASGKLRSYAIPVPDYGERVSALKGAYIANFADSGTRLLLLEDSGNPICERGLFLYAVEDTLRLLGGTYFDCDT
jgi:hypothetical protein